MKEITYLSLFSGIGGFEVGLENSKHSFKCIGYSEIDKYAKSIYQKNFPNHFDWGDAREIRTEELPDFDLLVGGFPCQAFSYAGLRRGFDDNRGTLFFEIARVLQDKRPQYFLLENVKGLLSHNKGKTFQTILEVLTDLGYTVKWSVLNSKDVGNVPQNRERVFIEGYSRTKCGGEVLSFPRPCGENIGEISNTYYGNRTGRVHYPNEHMNTLACSGHNGASSQLVVENVKLPVFKRKHEVDIQGLQKLLRTSKKQSKLSNKTIARELKLPLTLVSHWFRTDDYFSIPLADIWFDLKKLLGITDDSFDKPITEFEEVEGVYDMNNRIYSENGVAPTVKSTNNDLICLNKGASQAQKVYDPNGISPTLSACGGGDGGKTGLYLVPKREINVVANGSPTNHNSQKIISTDGLSPTLTATDYKHPKRIIEPSDNNKLEDGPMLKLRESTKKGYKEAYEGDGVEISRTNCSSRRGVAHKDSTGALNTQDGGWGTVTKDFRIRKLTPKECERLQAFPDDWTAYGVDDEKISDTQRYKCIGNAVTTTVVTYVVNNMFEGLNG